MLGLGGVEASFKGGRVGLIRSGGGLRGVGMVSSGSQEFEGTFIGVGRALGSGGTEGWMEERTDGYDVPTAHSSLIVTE